MYRLEGLDLASLQALVGVINERSFTEASKSLGVTQPAVSAALRKLEERVGTALVIRTRKGATASRAGELLATAATDAFERLDRAIAEISEQKEKPSGRIRFGCHESLAAYALPGFMAEFLREYPAVELTLWNGRSQSVEQAIINGDVDLGLVVNPSHHPDTVVTPIFKDSVELVCARPLKTAPPAQVLKRHPLVYVPELVQSQHILRALARAKLRPSRHLTCSSLDLVKSFTLSQVGIGILPRRVIAHGVPRNRWVSLSPTLPKYADSIALLRRFDLPVNAAVRAVIDRLSAHCQTLS
jgi:DNA-binding transcriptional LysR family regulator